MPRSRFTPSYKAREAWVSGLLLAPAVAVLALTALYPILNSAVISLYSWNPLDPNRSTTWVGLENYRKVLGDTLFQASLWRTILFVTASVAIELVLGMLIALVLVGVFKAVGVVRTAIFVPLMLTPVVAGILWGQMLNSQYGVINYVLESLHLPPQNLLGDPATALLGVVVVEVWQYTPVMALIFAAGLLARPVDVLEAAKVDGASNLQSFFFVTLPLLRPVIVVALVIRVMDAFKVFDTIYVLTQGGPVNATKVVSLLIYENGLKFFELGTASAMSWIFLILVSGLTLPFIWRLTRASR